LKRLALFLFGAFLLFEASFALSDRRMFFGSEKPGPRAGVSERPAVEAALAQLDVAMARYFGAGDEGPAHSVLVEPDGAGSPLHDWRLDRHTWLERGGVPSLELLERRVTEVGVSGLDGVFATATETWSATLDGGALPLTRLTVRYGFRRGSAGLLVYSVAVEP
jgi:hypothetical protein